jgi:hypothetical protein
MTVPAGQPRKRNPLAAPHTNVAGLVFNPHPDGVEVLIDAVFGAPYPLVVLTIDAADRAASRLLDLSLSRCLGKVR